MASARDASAVALRNLCVIFDLVEWSLVLQEYTADGDAMKIPLKLAVAVAAGLLLAAPGRALLIHNTLPPAHVRSHPYYRDRRLITRARTP
jgi:hypothetical protein